MEEYAPLFHFFELMHTRPSNRGRFGAGARCAGCRIDSGSAAFKKTALAPEKRLQMKKSTTKKKGKKWDKGVFSVQLATAGRF
jgi:hypothetical protein